MQYWNSCYRIQHWTQWDMPPVPMPPWTPSCLCHCQTLPVSLPCNMSNQRSFLHNSTFPTPDNNNYSLITSFTKMLPETNAIITAYTLLLLCAFSSELVLAHYVGHSGLDGAHKLFKVVLDAINDCTKPIKFAAMGHTMVNADSLPITARNLPHFNCNSITQGISPPFVLALYLYWLWKVPTLPGWWLLTATAMTLAPFSLAKAIPNQ